MKSSSATVDLRSRIRSAVTENGTLKVISVVFALIVYSLVHGGQEARRSIVVDLEIGLPPDNSDRVLVGSIPQSLRIFVRGSNQTIDNLRAASVSVQVDLTRAQPEHIVFAAPMVRLPGGVTVEVEQFDPPAIDLRWEPRIVREVPLQVGVVGLPASGFVVKNPLRVDPNSVRVRGPESEIKTLQFVRADAFDVHGLTEGIYPRYVAVEHANPRLKIEPLAVLVTVQIAREVAERVFSKLPVVVLGVGMAKSRTSPSEVDVRLVCPPEVIQSLRSEQVIPLVDVLSKDAAGTASLPLQVRIDRCSALITPPEVVVRWGY